MKRLIVTLLMLTILLSGVPVFAARTATDSEVELFFDKLVQEETVLTALYASGENFKSNGVTNDYIDEHIRLFITRVLNRAFVEVEDGTITKDNVQSVMQDMVMEEAVKADVVFVTVITEAFDDSVFDSLVRKQIPEQFMPLYNECYELFLDIIGLNADVKVSVNNQISQYDDELKRLLSQNNRIVNIDNSSLFDDMAGFEWANAAVNALAGLGAVNGKGNNMFAPADNVTREEFAKMISCTLGLYNKNASSDFIDIPKDHWCYPYVSSLYAKRLINGTGDNCFGFGEDITRQDMAVIMYRIGLSAQIFDESVQADRFIDNYLISDYAKDAVYTLRASGIMNGYDNYVNPRASASRAETAQLLYNFYQYTTQNK